MSLAIAAATILPWVVIAIVCFRLSDKMERDHAARYIDHRPHEPKQEWHL
jgi:hypothetical protein